MLTPDDPMEIALQLLAQGSDERAFDVAKRAGLAWSHVQATQARRRAADMVRWGRLGAKPYGRG